MYAFLAWTSLTQILPRVSFHARTLGTLRIQFAGRPKVFVECGLLRRHSVGIRAIVVNGKGRRALGRVPSPLGIHRFIRLPIRAPDDERLPARGWSVLTSAFATCDSHVTSQR